MTKDQVVDKTEQIRKSTIYQNIKKKNKKGYVTIHTSDGDLSFELYCNYTPKTCDNFLTLCERGYYDGTIFHRLIEKFMVQGGDPTGTGRGGDSIWNKPFEDEFSKLSHDSEGILSMANSGKNTNKSQFFITFAPCLHLDKKHTVFGKLISGNEGLKNIEKIKTDSQDKPLKEITILSTSVQLNPFNEEEEKEKKKEEQNLGPKEYGKWFSDPVSKKEEVKGEGVGKYLKLPEIQKRKTEEDNFQKKRVRKDFDFSGW